jgi:hypothetical protein
VGSRLVVISHGGAGIRAGLCRVLPASQHSGSSPEEGGKRSRGITENRGESRE